MLVRQRARSVVLRAALVAAMVVGLPACSGQSDDQPTPAAEPPSQQASPSPTEEALSPEEQAKQDKLASAVARYQEYFDVTAEYAQRGENGFKALQDQGFYGSQEIMDSEATFWRTLAKDDLRLKGKQQVIDAELVKVKGDPLDSIAENRLVMDVCVDVGAADIVDSEGTSVLEKKRQVPSIIRIEMQGQGSEGQAGRWSLAKATQTKEDC